MKTRMATLLLTLLALGVSACGKESGNTESPAKDAAIAWLSAAAKGNNGGVQAVTDPEYVDTAIKVASILREDDDYVLKPAHLKKVRWTPSEIVGDVHEWTAHTPVGMVAFKLKDFGGTWKVIEVDLI